ncbi:MAG: hypothetical protein AB1689_25675 [Thermodesulfobacteriota bacterium]
MELPASRAALDADHPIYRVQRTGLMVGVAALVLSAIGWVVTPEQFYRSYLLGYLFWFGIALGSMAVLMIHHIAGGAWGAVIRRLLESSIGTIPILALFFLPIAFGMHHLYEWTHAAEVAHDPVLQAKAPYLNVPFFLVRAVFYFAVWIALATLLRRWSLEQDATDDPRTTTRLELLSRGGLVLYGLTVSFAAIDWMMSLQPHWFSTVYGLLVMGGQGLAAFAFAIPLAVLLSRQRGLAPFFGPAQFHDLGNLMLAFTMIWAYLAFSQLLIIWSGNLPEEISWYLRRSAHGWPVVGYGLVLLGFGLPFAVLLSRRLKRTGPQLAIVALWVIAIRFVDLYWLVVPSFDTSALPHWLDFVTVIGIGGVWLWFFVGRLVSHPVLPLRDPSLPEVEA